MKERPIRLVSRLKCRKYPDQKLENSKKSYTKCNTESHYMSICFRVGTVQNYYNRISCDNCEP